MVFQDSFYTPKKLSDRLINYISLKKVDSIVDFCVGDGELLRSACRKWPKANIFGFDISPIAVKQTSKKHPKWKVSILDFLNESKRRRSRVLEQAGLFDVILLNPPFSCVGSTNFQVEYMGITYHVSTAMKFLVEALKYLRPRGVLYAILPTSTAYSQKDAKLWSALEETVNLSILEESNEKFKGCNPNIILVALNDREKHTKVGSFTRVSLDFNNIDVFRGKISMNELPVQYGKIHFVHTTNLTNNKISNLSLKFKGNRSNVSGPAILIPRVGLPKKDKICLIGISETYMISDCILAIKFKSFKEATSLYNYLVNNYELLNQLYKGTAAKYITVERLKQFLNIDLQYDYLNSQAI